MFRCKKAARTDLQRVTVALRFLGWRFAIGTCDTIFRFYTYGCKNY